MGEKEFAGKIGFVGRRAPLEEGQITDEEADAAPPEEPLNRGWVA